MTPARGLTRKRVSSSSRTETELVAVRRAGPRRRDTATRSRPHISHRWSETTNDAASDASSVGGAEIAGDADAPDDDPEGGERGTTDDGGIELTGVAAVEHRDPREGDAPERQHQRWVLAEDLGTAERDTERDGRDARDEQPDTETRHSDPDEAHISPCSPVD